MAVPASFGPEFRVNTSTTGSQSEPSMTALADGRFVVVWQDDNGNVADDDVKAQVYNADGSRFGGELTVATGTGHQSHAAVAARPDGGFVVAWTEGSPTATTGDGSGSSINARVYGVDGTAAGAAFLANTASTADNQDNAAITSLSGGGFVIAWQSHVSATVDRVWARAFDAAGTALSAGGVVETATAHQTQPTVTGLSNGAYVVGWSDSRNSDGDGDHVRGRVLSGAGVPAGSAFVLNAPTTGNQSQPALAGLSDGNFVAVWRDDVTGTGDIRMRRFDATGHVIGGSAFAIDADAGVLESQPVVAATDSGFIVAWRDAGSADENDGSGSHIRVKLYANNGTAVSDEFIANSAVTLGSQSNPTLTRLADGRFVVSWQDPGADATQADAGSPSVRAAIFDPRTEAVHLSGTALGDDFVGTGFADHLSGDDGDDHLAGTRGDDHLKGGKGGDTLDGGKGDDSLKGGKGADTLIGGGGEDHMHAEKDDKKDVFVYLGKDDSGDSAKHADKIYDFDRKNGHEKHTDKIDLSAIDADKGQNGDQHFRFVSSFHHADKGDPDGQVTVESHGSHVEVLVDFNGNDKADMVMLVMHTETLNKDDFIL